MGIHGLTKVISDHAPGALKNEPNMANLFGRKVAIDASMSIYQFLIAVRTEGNVLMNEQGETTSHLLGLFYRTIRMVENGLKPLYVFDGKPPTLKSGELAKRTERRKEAQTQLDAATQEGNVENMDKFNRRLVKVTPEHNQECKKLLKILGIPYIDAPCEAEAQCANLCKEGKVYAAGSEDMDTITFGSKVLLRHLTMSEARKMPIVEIRLDKVLEGLEMSMDQFIDLCILLGCDYCDSIRGIGPHRAVQLIKEHKNIETILKNLDTKKYAIPENWPFEEARALFKTPDVTDAKELEFKWEEPDEEAAIQFLVREKGFNEDRVRNGIKKLIKSKGKAVQGRIDSFFKPIPKSPASIEASKRKAELLQAESKKKGKKVTGKSKK